MRRKSAERQAVAAKAITYEQRDQTIEAARSAGYLIFECGPLLLARQIVALNQADAADTHVWFDWMTWEGSGEQAQFLLYHGYIDEKITYGGARRRQGWLRRYAELDLAPEEISTGDRIALQIGEEVFPSRPVRQISGEPGLVVAENRLHIPQLVLSAE